MDRLNSSPLITSNRPPFTPFALRMGKPSSAFSTTVKHDLSELFAIVKSNEEGDARTLSLRLGVKEILDGVDAMAV